MSAKRLDPRKLMELAVEVMRSSVHEQRTDGKPTPLVGAALWLPDGTVQTACRGELRDGDHAEFTLLERKNRATRLDDARLFCTLEPCAPGSRRHPKLDCSERIVLARIKEVWVGLGDLHPTVAGKGLEYLRASGVTVHMFDRDLQDKIEAANREFLEYGAEQAVLAAAGRKPKALAVSKLELGVPVGVKDAFSAGALERYRGMARITEAADSDAFYERLVLQGVLARDGDKYVPTAFGLLLFGEHPREALNQAGLLGTIHYPNGKEETKDFDGPLVLIPEQALEWLRGKLPNPIDRGQAQRRELHGSFFELVREGIANALIHRDYGILGAKCQLIARPDSVTVMSPGAPVPPLTLEQLQAFDAPMLSRNPVLHYVCARMDLAEERGLGLKSMKAAAQSANLPLPRYSWKDPYLVLAVHRSAMAALRDLPPGLLDSLNAAERAGWEWLSKRGSGKSGEYASEFGVEERTARRHLNKLVELGLARKSGSGRATRYEL